MSREGSSEMSETECEISKVGGKIRDIKLIVKQIRWEISEGNDSFYRKDLIARFIHLRLVFTKTGIY